ncbi:hypothetical protein ROMU108268_21575 [Roseomonas mucosa]
MELPPLWLAPRLISASAMASTMKSVARTAVERVSRLAVPRPVMKAPIPWEEPMPRPPPSLRWSSTTPISARATKKCRTSRTVVMVPGF